MINRKQFQKSLYWLVLLAGIALFLLAFRKIKFDELITELSSVKPIYLLWLLIPSWGGQFLRAYRWRLLLGKDSDFKSVYHALLFGYFVNLALPRVGEISRCAAVQSLGGPKFTHNLGTVIAERLADLLMLIASVILAFYFNGEALTDWGRERIFSPIWNWLLFNHVMVIAIGTIAVLCFIAFLIYSQQWLRRMGAKAENTFKQLRNGMFSILRLKSKRLILFGLLTIGIWVGYFLTTWLWFLALPSAREAGIVMAFSVMVIGSLVKTLPIQGGGMGAYHLVIGELLMLYGLGSLSSTSFALLNHGYQTVFYLLFGGFSALWITGKRAQLKQKSHPSLTD